MFIFKKLLGFHFGEKAEFVPTYRFKSAFPIGAYVNRANVWPFLLRTVTIDGINIIMLINFI